VTNTVDAIDVYRKLAEEHNRLNHPLERDRFLLLAADAALTAGQRDEAERFRRSILSQNPNHLLKPYGTLDEALKSSDILAYVQQLRRSYPQDKAATMLDGLKKSAPPPSAPAPAKPIEAEEDLVLPLDMDRGGKPTHFTIDKPEPKKPTRPKEVKMNESPQPARGTPNPLAPWQQGASPKEPTGGPGIFGLRPEPAPAPRPSFLPTPSAPEAATESEEAPAGGWVGTFLGVIIVLAALAMLIYTFGAPFVPWW
jgi:hypothetical protein